MINNNRHMDIYLVCKREIHLLGFIDYFWYVCNWWSPKSEHCKSLFRAPKCRPGIAGFTVSGFEVDLHKQKSDSRRSQTESVPAWCKDPKTTEHLFQHWADGSLWLRRATQEGGETGRLTFKEFTSGSLSFSKLNEVSFHRSKITLLPFMLAR